MGIMERLYCKEHLQNKAIYAQLVWETYSDRIMVKSLHVKNQWTNLWCIFIRQKSCFNESVQQSWTVGCGWINCLKAPLAAPSRCFVSAILLIFLQAHNTHKRGYAREEKKLEKRKIMECKGNDTHW